MPRRRRLPSPSTQAATIILDGVREERWRILVGEDTEAVDCEVRANPEQPYKGEQAMARATASHKRKFPQF